MNFKSNGTADMVQRIEQLEHLCSELYAAGGELGMSGAMLDNTLAAANGEPIPHASVLPFENDARRD